MDDLTKTGKEDRIRINCREDWELQYWCRKFDCKRGELIAAVGEVGPMAEDVARYLKVK